MYPRLLRALPALLIASACFGQAPPPPQATVPAPAAAPAPAPAAPNVTVPGGLNLNNASLVDVINILAQDLHINYILDPAVKGTVTINTYGQLRALDVRTLLETILRMNNCVMVEVGNIYRIVPAAKASSLPVTPQANAREFPEDERQMLNLVFLKYVTAGEMVKLLEPFMGESFKMVSYEPANLLIIQDNARNMKRTMDLINLFDSEQLAGQRVQTFAITNARPSDIAKDLDRILKGFAFNEKSTPVRLLPLDRIGMLLAFASNPGSFEQVSKWVKQLDVPLKVTAGSVDNHVYRLKFGRAEIVGSVIAQLYGAPGAGFGSSMMGAYPSGFGNAFGRGLYGGGTGGGGFGGGGFGGSQYGGGQYGGGFGGGFGGGQYGGGGYGGGQYGAGAYGANVAPYGAQPAAGPTASPFTAAPAAGTTPGTSGTAAADQTGTYLGATPAGGMPRGAPRIIPNPFDNTLLIQSTPEQWEQISSLLDQLDIAPRQVLIECKIFEVDLVGDFAMGVEAFLQKLSNANKKLVGSSNALFTPGLQLSAGALVGHSRELLGMLTAQETSGKTKVISTPSIIATDSIPAAITVGEDVPTLASQAVNPGILSGGTSQFTQTIQTRSTGASLNIMARVNASGVVTMIIDQEVSAPVATTSSNIESPSFSHRDVSTQVTVEDGDTVAIGGIISESSTLGTSGIPYLSRIPVLGVIFGNRNTHKDRTELIVFLTPRVIADTTQIAEATDELRSRVKRLSKIIKEQ